MDTPQQGIIPVLGSATRESSPLVSSIFDVVNISPSALSPTTSIGIKFPDLGNLVYAWYFKYLRSTTVTLPAAMRSSLIVFSIKKELDDRYSDDKLRQLSFASIFNFITSILTIGPDPTNKGGTAVSLTITPEAASALFPASSGISDDLRDNIIASIVKKMMNNFADEVIPSLFRTSLEKLTETTGEDFFMPELTVNDIAANILSCHHYYGYILNAESLTDVESFITSRLESNKISTAVQSVLKALMQNSGPVAKVRLSAAFSNMSELFNQDKLFDISSVLPGVAYKLSTSHFADLLNKLSFRGVLYGFVFCSRISSGQVAGRKEILTRTIASLIEEQLFSLEDPTMALPIELDISEEEEAVVQELISLLWINALMLRILTMNPGVYASITKGEIANVQRDRNSQMWSRKCNMWADNLAYQHGAFANVCGWFEKLLRHDTLCPDDTVYTYKQLELIKTLVFKYLDKSSANQVPMSSPHYWNDVSHAFGQNPEMIDMFSFSDFMNEIDFDVPTNEWASREGIVYDFNLNSVRYLRTGVIEGELSDLIVGLKDVRLFKMTSIFKPVHFSMLPSDILNLYDPMLVDINLRLMPEPAFQQLVLQLGLSRLLDQGEILTFSSVVEFAAHEGLPLELAENHYKNYNLPTAGFVNFRDFRSFRTVLFLYDEGAVNFTNVIDVRNDKITYKPLVMQWPGFVRKFIQSSFKNTGRSPFSDAVFANLGPSDLTAEQKKALATKGIPIGLMVKAGGSTPSTVDPGATGADSDTPPSSSENPTDEA